MLIIKKDILVTDQCPTQGLDDTTLAAASVKYAFNFTQSRKRFVSNVQYNGGSIFTFGNAVKMYQLKGTDKTIYIAFR